jgi:hypothetical protein
VGRVNLIRGTVSSVDGPNLVVAVEGTPHRLKVVAAEVPVGASEVTLAVRPEAVAIAAPGSGEFNGTNTYDASVHAVSFLGDHYEYRLEAGALPLTVQSPRLLQGERLQVHIPPEACAVVE